MAACCRSRPKPLTVRKPRLQCQPNVPEVLSANNVSDPLVHSIDPHATGAAKYGFRSMRRTRSFIPHGTSHASPRP
eukprot:836733-Lingulodinium_polyedra.AAC.1